VSILVLRNVVNGVVHCIYYLWKAALWSGLSTFTLQIL